MDLVSVEGNSRGSRKIQKKEWKKSEETRKRYAAKDVLLVNWNIPCNHKANNTYMCKDVDVETLLYVKKCLYKDSNRDNQNARIANLIQLHNPKRHRERDQVRSHKPHKFQIKYTIRKGHDVYTVCREFFQKLFEVSSRRVLTVAKHIHKGEEVKDRRGGDRRSFKQENRKESVKQFIGKFKARENHYNRAKSQRLYLPSTLTISKMFKMYNDSVVDSLKVKYSFFHKVFSRDFNLGFGSPATDVCSYCERLKYNISKAQEADEKARLISELKVHKMKARQFTLIMKEPEEGTMKICFDLQQVQNLPKLPNQETFYSHQIALYVFCIVDVLARNPTFYIWTEEKSGRGSNEIGSAILNYLRTGDFANVSKLHLFADGCGGQNKNSHILHMLMVWLYKESPENIQEIELTFPVRGHSYLPADRVFGRVEKELRRHEKLVLPDDYYKLYKEFGNVRVLGKDWCVYDLKDHLSILKKYEGISEQKKFFIKKASRGNNKKVTINSEVFYRNRDPSKIFKSLLKRGKTLESCNWKEIKEPHGIKADKGKSVNNLLKVAFGPEWIRDNDLSWYFDILRDFIKDVPEVEEEACTCIDEETEVKM